MQKQLEDLYKDKPYKLSQLTYEDKKVKIKNGKIEKYSSAFANKNSDFLQYIWFHQSPSMAVAYIDKFIHLAFKANEYTVSTLPPTYFITDKLQTQLNKETQERINTLQHIMDQYYHNELVAPAGFSTKLFFEKIYTDRLADGTRKQIDEALDEMAVSENQFFNDWIKG